MSVGAVAEGAGCGLREAWYLVVSMLENVCSLTTECVLLLQHVFSYYSMCSLTVEWGEDEDAGYWVS